MITSLSEGECQLVVVDSPGLIGLEHAKEVIKTHSESKILIDPEKALEKAEHVIVVDVCFLALCIFNGEDSRT